ncbi:phosphatase PAP2 family protein [Providencia alcalifaciens]|uniref:phosphatase PAP2 family protein n=1 Tax=Providencia alcalifaciens TaxID=126385 RepID=UPI002B057FD9|nr:phosphatase PAP2 family protein [Providencia alcalifaciens]
MRKSAYLIAISVIFLLLPPIVMIATGWQWTPEHQPSMKWLLWLTDSAGVPYSYGTFVFLTLLTLIVFRHKRNQWQKLLVVITLCILGAQGVKSFMKSTFQEPRPYVVWLEKTYQIPHQEFYDLKRGERADLIKNTVKSNTLIPKWQRKHWQAETGYSFPSGHMFFAAGWALLLIVLFWQQRQYALGIIILCWAQGIGLSRMLLGMHWPIDIIASTLMSALFALLGYWIYQSRFLEK